MYGNRWGEHLDARIEAESTYMRQKIVVVTSIGQGGHHGRGNSSWGSNNSSHIICFLRSRSILLFLASLCNLWDGNILIASRLPV